ncbi:hypothetical protein pb186bvf_021110 [Paramecium bursaria]
MHILFIISLQFFKCPFSNVALYVQQQDNLQIDPIIDPIQFIQFL